MDNQVAVTLEKILPALPNGIKLFDVDGQTVFPVHDGETGEPNGMMYAYLVKAMPSGKFTNHPIEIDPQDSCEVLYEKLKTAIKQFAVQEIA